MRVSKTRNQILDVLKKLPNPIDAIYLTKKIGVNKTTIYRDLETLLKQNLISEVEFGEGKKRYEFKKDHHHHIVCKTCGKIEDIKINEKNFINKLENQTNFLIENHSIEFFGKCFNCKTL